MARAWPGWIAKHGLDALCVWIIRDRQRRQNVLGPKDVKEIIMLSSKSFLCLDFGAGSVKAAEFEVNQAGGLSLKQYGTKSLGIEGSQDSKREKVVLTAH